MTTDTADLTRRIHVDLVDEILTSLDHKLVALAKHEHAATGQTRDADRATRLLNTLYVALVADEG